MMGRRETPLQEPGPGKAPFSYYVTNTYLGFPASHQVPIKMQDFSTSRVKKINIVGAIGKLKPSVPSHQVVRSLVTAQKPTPKHWQGGEKGRWSLHHHLILLQRRRVLVHNQEKESTPARGVNAYPSEYRITAVTEHLGLCVPTTERMSRLRHRNREP